MPAEFDNSPALPPNARHAATLAWHRFRLSQASLFTGSPQRWALESRLKVAFEEGWNAAACALSTAVGEMAARHDTGTPSEAPKSADRLGPDAPTTDTG